MITAILFISFFAMLLNGVPIAICLSTSSVLTILYASNFVRKFANLTLSVVATNTYTGISKFLLLAIPFFVLSGNIMAKAGISQRLVKFIDDMVGHRRGSLAIVCVIVACFFGAISGSGPATVAALGAVLIPAMVDSGFDISFAEALMATSSSIAIVIPPSIAFVVYASITGESVGQLFMAGIIPGILMGIALAIVVKREARIKHIEPSHPRRSAAERWASFKEAFWGLLMPVIILGGIYGGIFTPTEAAAVSAVYGLIVGLFVYRTLKLKDLKKIIIDSASTTAVVMLITAAASLFAYVLTRARINVAISSALENFAAGNTVVFLIIVNICLLIAGCFLDSTSALYIFTPLFLPVAQALGMNLVHFGTIMIVNLAIGLVTPPVGVNLYVACGIAKVDLKAISKAVIPLIIASLIVLLLVTYIPQISLVLLGGG